MIKVLYFRIYSNVKLITRNVFKYNILNSYFYCSSDKQDDDGVRGVRKGDSGQVRGEGGGHHPARGLPQVPGLRAEAGRDLLHQVRPVLLPGGFLQDVWAEVLCLPPRVLHH